MTIFIWTVLVGILGWGVSLVMKSDASNRHILHASIGVAGALLGGFLMAMPTRINMPESDSINVLSLLVSFFIALALSMIANLWDRVTAQDDFELDF